MLSYVVRIEATHPTHPSSEWTLLNLTLVFSPFHRYLCCRLAEQNGIVFIDEVDKIISNKSKHSGDASAEGVQRDLLPLIEGTTVEVRRFGNVRTDYMLFVASGAFHDHKPSDLLAELQGRLPIRVELKGLNADDLERILTEPRFNLLEQQRSLMAAEGVTLTFQPEAVKEVVRLAAEINRTVENIGARRLHTVSDRRGRVGRLH